jgi:hypothetical protein
LHHPSRSSFQSCNGKSNLRDQNTFLTMASLRSWFSIPRGSHFSLANIPFGIISTASLSSPRVAVAIGDHALDLEAFAANNGFSGLSTIQPHQSVFSQPSLNAFAALGRPIHSVVRKYIQTVFSEETTYPDLLKNNIALQKQVLIPLTEVKAHLPFKIGDYTDFFAGLNHAYKRFATKLQASSGWLSWPGILSRTIRDTNSTTQWPNSTQPSIRGQGAYAQPL